MKRLRHILSVTSTFLLSPRQNGSRIFASTDNKFWESRKQISPISAQGPEGDCLQKVCNLDDDERFSLADENDLATKETVDLQFPTNSGQSYGFVIGCRQSLLPTYLLYQTYAYMGNNAGYWLAEIERNKLHEQPGSIEDLIGGIEIAIQQADGEWQPLGTVNEHGPLASDVHLLPLPQLSGTTANIRMRMTKGTWRIDYVALAEISQPLQPIRIHPSLVLKENEEDPEALAALLDSAKTLVTFPGDSYSLKYTLPSETANYELFLESRGYYLEWIRKEWIEEENPILLGEMFISPQSALRRLAPQFKQVEPQMEECFWRSRYAKP